MSSNTTDPARDTRGHAPFWHGLGIVALAAVFTLLLFVLAYITLFAVIGLSWFGFVVPFGAVLLVVALVDRALSAKRCLRCGEALPARRSGRTTSAAGATDGQAHRHDPPARA
ncbi:hypothetical protein [Streptacidiphilus fuscans]|uniref:Uncharacterized protein n=1 Tax=Streptacidiphilus fuscans TaxID=2789292 RepID=A0A931B879_9ACTN|nr:hypothetical protein [Streptacidiphilus fuscans]MBF9072264.1 hypothetical protein [Streptacidiphilus fuscans]